MKRLFASPTLPHFPPQCSPLYTTPFLFSSIFRISLRQISYDNGYVNFTLWTRKLRYNRGIGRVVKSGENDVFRRTQEDMTHE